MSVYGAGRVTSTLGSIDCPGECFARVLLADRTLDGAPSAVSLQAQASFGSHFDHWQLEATDVGVRARGPAQCSPMTRTAAVVPIDESVNFVRLPLGETKRTVVHLVNFTPTRRTAANEFIEAAVPVHAIAFALRTGSAPARVTLVPGDHALAFRQEGDYCHVTVPTVETHAIVAFED